MQFQSNLLGCTVQRPACLETTALGAAMLAGLAVGVWESQEELAAVWKSQTVYQPRQEFDSQPLLDKWHKAVRRCRMWEE